MKIQQRVSILVMVFLLSGTLWGMEANEDKLLVCLSGINSVIFCDTNWKKFKEKILKNDNNDNERILKDLLNCKLPIKESDAVGENTNQKIESLIAKLLKENKPKPNSSLKELKSAVKILKTLRKFFIKNMTI